MEADQGLSILSFEGIRLAFPLSEAVGIQRSADLEENHDIPLAVASVVYASRRWPVFRLDVNFEPLISSLPNDIHCVCLSSDDGQTGVALVCEEIEAFRLGPDNLVPTLLPTCMQREATPLWKLFLHGEYLLPVSTAPLLATYLRSLIKERGEQINQ